MEQILRVLPPKPASPVVSYGTTAALVGLCFLALLGLRGWSGVPGWFVMYPAVFVPSVLFDRGTGFCAAFLGAGLIYLVSKPADEWLIPTASFVGLALFLLLAISLAVISDGMRRAWEKAIAAERAKDLLLQELGHRTKNNLTMAISVLSLQSRAKSDPQMRASFEKAISRIRAISSAHEHFHALAHDGRVEMRSYLETLCSHLGDSLRDVRPIAVRAEIDKIYLKTEQAIPVGLIVNELVTNALKHAFPSDSDGIVVVSLRREQRILSLVVKDNGIGCPVVKTEGVGSRLMRLFVQQLGATISWTDAEPGCSVRCLIPAE